jgi:hypothetical protein
MSQSLDFNVPEADEATRAPTDALQFDTALLVAIGAAFVVLGFPDVLDDSSGTSAEIAGLVLTAVVVTVPVALVFIFVSWHELRRLPTVVLAAVKGAIATWLAVGWLSATFVRRTRSWTTPSSHGSSHSASANGRRRCSSSTTAWRRRSRRAPCSLAPGALARANAVLGPDAGSSTTRRVQGPALGGATMKAPAARDDHLAPEIRGAIVRTADEATPPLDRITRLRPRLSRDTNEPKEGATP